MFFNGVQAEIPWCPVPESGLHGSKAAWGAIEGRSPKPY